MAPPPPPELMDDAVGEILLRIPPDDPAHLFRASLVCKPWRRLVTDPAFLRRYRAFHRTPPVLGFLRCKDLVARFIPMGSFRPRDPERRNCRVLDCRHGRVLLADYTSRDFLVWDPITGEDQHIPNGIDIWSCYNAAVLCAAADCDHLNCHGGPFLVVLVANYEHENQFFVEAFVYSSEAGEWSTPTTVGSASVLFIERLPPVLAGDKLCFYFICEFGWSILRYDLRDATESSLIEGCDPYLYRTIAFIPWGEDGGLRLAGLNYYQYKLDLWSLETMNPDGRAVWRQHGVIQLDTLLSLDDSSRLLNLIGFAKVPDAADVVFVSTDTGVFMIGLESHTVRKVYDKDCGQHPIFPYSSFFTPDCAVGRLPLPQQ